MLQRLPTALAKVKAGNNLLNEIRKIIYYFYQSKEITKKVYNSIIKSLQIQKWMLHLRTLKIVKLLSPMC